MSEALSALLGEIRALEHRAARNETGRRERPVKRNGLETMNTTNMSEWKQQIKQQLGAERAKLSKRIGEIDADLKLLGAVKAAGGGAVVVRKPATRRKTRFGKGELQGYIRDALKPNLALRARDILKRVPGRTTAHVLGQALSKMIEAGQIKRQGTRGSYAYSLPAAKPNGIAAKAVA